MALRLLPTVLRRNPIYGSPIRLKWEKIGRNQGVFQRIRKAPSNMTVYVALGHSGGPPGPHGRPLNWSYDVYIFVKSGVYGSFDYPSLLKLGLERMREHEAHEQFYDWEERLTQADLRGSLGQFPNVYYMSGFAETEEEAKTAIAQVVNAAASSGVM